MGADSDEGEVEFPGVDAKIEKEDMEMSDMGPEDDVKIQGSNMEGKEPPPNVVEINDTDIPQDPSLIALKVPDYPDGPTQVSSPSIEGPHRSTRFR